MWILGRSCDEQRASLKIAIPPGAYFVPRSYDVHRLAVLARLLCDAGQKVRDTVVMTWKQADVLEALGRVRGDGHRSDALWALHGGAGAPLPFGSGDLKSFIAARFPALRPQWVLILDPEAPASTAGWLEAHVKMALVSWLGRILGDERHPLHAAAVDRLDVQALARMTSDPLEMMEIVENAVEHRLTYAFPGGIEGAVSPDRANVEVIDWDRSVRVAAARRLARRVNEVPEAIRGDAARVLLGIDLAVERREGALDGLVRAGIVVPPTPSSDGHLALARTVLGDDDGRSPFRDALALSADDRKEIDRADGRGHPGAHVGAESVSTTVSVDAGRAAMAPDEVLRQYEPRKQAAETRGAPAAALTSFADVVQGADPSLAESFFERAIAAAPSSANALGNYATFLERQGRLDQAQELFERAITANPKHANNLGNYANFLWQKRYDLNQAQELYERAIVADPTHANNLGNYASFLRMERRDLDQAQELYERALAADPEDAVHLGNYASFLWKERRDLDSVQELYERAIAADPKHANHLGNYATFLWEERRDLDCAQELFERAITADPKHANNLGNYATFLRLERRDLDRAQALYERALIADPRNMEALGNYANFLCVERHDLDRAQELYGRVVAIDPSNVNNLANSAHVLFLAGRRSAALERLREAIAQARVAPVPPASDLVSELAFYRAVHVHEERDDALRALHALIAEGARSPGWNFRAHALLAEKAADPDAPLFFALADVLSGKADPSTLAAFPRWTQASSPSAKP